MLYFTVFCIFLFGLADACNVLTEPVQSACEYSAFVKLTSRPDNIVIQRENCSAEVNKTEWQEVPLCQMETPEDGKTYTVIAIDPDAPNHVTGEYYLHWLVSNIQPKDLIIGDLSKGKTLIDYKGPGPVINTGLHRYIFLVFEEEKGNQSVHIPAERRKFALLPWLQGHTDKLCGPVAGVQFRAHY